MECASAEAPLIKMIIVSISNRIEIEQEPKISYLP